MRRRTLAALIGIWFVAGGFLARRHEATVVHAVELATGQIVHAERFVGHHDDDSRSDIHDRGEAHADHDLCLDAAMLRTATMASSCTCIIVASSSSQFPHEHTFSDLGDIARHVYRLAPKTSPPAA